MDKEPWTDASTDTHKTQDTEQTQTHDSQISHANLDR